MTDADRTEPTGWDQLVAENPGHSAWYIERFRSMAAAGDDLAGEARFVDAMAPRQARILDAGCGPGRVGAVLADAGHTVVGVDADAELIAAAKQDHPRPTWLVGDLSRLQLAERGIREGFDVIVCAGNVMTFVAPSTRGDVLVRLGAHLRPAGRIAVGFGSGRGYDFGDFRNDVTDAGLVVDLEFATWDLWPFGDEADFLVAVLSPAR